MDGQVCLSTGKTYYMGRKKLSINFLPHSRLEAHNAHKTWIPVAPFAKYSWLESVHEKSKPRRKF